MRKAMAMIGLLAIQLGMFAWVIERVSRFSLSEFLLTMGGMIFVHLAIVGIADLIREEPPETEK